MEVKSFDGLSASINDSQYPLVILKDGHGDIYRVMQPMNLDIGSMAIINEHDLNNDISIDDVVHYLDNELNYEEVPLVHSS